MRVDINLATRPYEDLRRFWFRWGGAVAALAIVTAALIYHTVAGWVDARKDRRLTQQYEQQIAERDQEKAQAQALMNLPQNRSTRDRSQFLNDLFQRKAFSWTKVFEDLEKVMPPRLHVVSIHPEMGLDNQLEINLVVAGESRDRADDLVSKMEASQHFHETYIKQESAETGLQAGDNVQFNISAIYVPEVAGGHPEGTP